MQVLFLRPLLEEVLYINKKRDMAKRYGFNNDVIQQITDSRYEVMNCKKCCTELLDLFNALSCLPLMIGTKEDCDKFEAAVRREISSINNTDIIWMEPLKQAFTNNIATVNNILSNRVVLRNGKSFQRATTISKELIGCSIYDYRVISEITRFSDEEVIGDNKPKNYAKSVSKMLEVAQYNSFEFIFHQMTEDLTVFEDGDVWIGCKIAGNIGLYSTEDELIEKLMQAGIGNANPFADLKIICRSKYKFRYGYWKTNTGIWRKTKTNSDVISFLRMFDDDNCDTVEVKILEE